MRMLSSMRRQQAVYWPPAVAGDDGRRAFGDPVQLRVRWVDETKEVTTPAGTTAMSSTAVYTGEDVAPGGAMLLGTLADVAGDGTDPFESPGALEIKSFEKFPTLKATDFLRTARL